MEPWTHSETRDDWVVASATRNWIARDPILDWLDRYGEEAGYHRDHEADGYLPQTDIVRFRREQGRRFEARVAELVHDRLAPLGGLTQPAKRFTREETLALLNEGVAAIYQGTLASDAQMTCGVPDLLVRRDALALIFDAPLPGSLPRDDAYVVVDVKFKGVALDSKGERLTRGEAVPDKVQIALYAEMLAEAGYGSGALGVLLGRSTSYTTTIQKQKVETRCEGCFDRAGLFEVYGDLLTEAREAADYLREMRAEGRAWGSRLGRHRHLRPNFGNAADAPWSGAKRSIGEDAAEPTRYWQVGVRGRDEYLSLVPDPPRGHVPGAAADLGVHERHHPRLDALFHADRTEGGDGVHPARIAWGDGAWRDESFADFYVDVETLNDLADDCGGLPARGGEHRVFMVGCGHLEGGVWHFSCFSAEDGTLAAERAMLDAWTDHMARIAGARPIRAIVWSDAERRYLHAGRTSAAERHAEGAFRDAPLYDFLEEVIRPKSSPSECVAVRGARGFGLKEVGKALHALGYIGSTWGDGPGDGEGAMAGAWWCYAESVASGVPVREIEIARDGGDPVRLFELIERYNETDCRVMQECVAWFRTNR